MIQEIARIEFELTGSELIALLRESQLIKQHLPFQDLATSQKPMVIQPSPSMIQMLLEVFQEHLPMFQVILQLLQFLDQL